MGKLCDRISPLKIAVPAAFIAAVTAVIQAFSGNVTVFASARFWQFIFAGVPGIFVASGVFFLILLPLSFLCIQFLQNKMNNIEKG